MYIGTASPLFPFISFSYPSSFFFRSTIEFTPSLSPARMRERFARSFSVAFSANAYPYQLFLSLSFSLFFIHRVTRACRRLTELSIISRMVGLHARANLESACRDCGKSVEPPPRIDVSFGSSRTRLGCLEARVSISPSPNHYRKHLLRCSYVCLDLLHSILFRRSRIKRHFFNANRVAI